MMRSFLSLILVGLMSFFIVHREASATELINNIGIQDNYILPCPAISSCVVSLGAGDKHYIAPISYHTNLNQAKETLLKVLTVVPRTQVLEITDNYIRAESTGKIFGRIDELEFYFLANQPMIQLRSASRHNKFDLGVNRRRLEQIRLALRDLNI